MRCLHPAVVEAEVGAAVGVADAVLLLKNLAPPRRRPAHLPLVAEVNEDSSSLGSGPNIRKND